jgi:thiamine transporter
MSDSQPSSKPTSTVTTSLTQTMRVRMLAEVAGAVALSGALNLVRIFTFPEGGSITLASMAPVILLALRRGTIAGTIAGAIFGLVDLIEEPFVVHPLQLLLDYPIAFGALGLAGLFQRKHWEKLVQSRPLMSKVLPIIGVVVAISARFVSHFVSGIVYFSSYAPSDEGPIIYSIVYNASYLLPEMIMTAIVISILVRFNVLDLYP